MKKICILFFIIMNFSSLFASAKYGELSGEIKDPDRHNYRELTISLTEFEKHSDPKAYQGKCNNQGDFRITGINPGRYLIGVFRNGEKLYENGVVIEKGRQRISIILKKASLNNPLIRETSSSTVSGRIYDSETREPLENVSLMIEKVYTVSDAQGRYSVSGIPLGIVPFHLVRKDSHLPVMKEIMVNENLYVKDFLMEPVIKDMSVYGRIQDSKDEILLKGALITINGKNYITNELGEFLAEKIVKHNEIIEMIISADGYQTYKTEIPFKPGIHRMDVGLKSGTTIINSKKEKPTIESVKALKEKRNEKSKHHLVKDPEGFCCLSSVTGLADIPDAQVLRKDVFEFHARYISSEQGNSVDKRETGMMLYGVNVGLYNNLELGVGFLDTRNKDLTRGAVGTTGIYNLKYRFQDHPESPVNYAVGYQKYHYDANQVKDVDTMYFSMDYIFLTSRMMDKVTANLNFSDFGDFTDTTFNLGLELTPLRSRYPYSWIIEGMQDTENQFSKLNIGFRLMKNPGFDVVFSRNFNNDTNNISFGSHVKF